MCQSRPNNGAEMRAAVEFNLQNANKHRTEVYVFNVWSEVNVGLFGKY